MLNLATLLEDNVRKNPDKTAVVSGADRLTFKEVDEAACRVANGLVASGLQAGEKIALSCGNSADFPIAYFGILKMGGVVVPLNILLKRREIAYHLEDSDAAAYICIEGDGELPSREMSGAAFEDVSSCRKFWLRGMDAGPPTEGTATWHDLIVDQPTAFDTIQTMPDDTSVILYTSGTTGQPKGAELSHSNMVMNAIVSRDLMSSTAEDVTLIALPLYHSFGQTFLMNAALFAGGRIVLAPRFDPAIVFQLLQDEDVTLYAGVPTMYWELLNYPEADRFDIEKIARTLRIADSGGGPMPIDVMRQFEEKFGVLILEGYGLTETSPVATSNVALKVRKTGTIGLPIWGVEIRIVDEEMNDVPVGETGEIVIRGHNVMKGYYNRPEETAEAFRGGWLHTGDLGAFDDDGYITVVGRLKDLIIRSGFNIYPREIEEFLVSHPEITLAAVIGVPDPRCGEEIKAFVVLEAGSTLNADTIVALSKAELAAHKYPRMVEIIEELPMGPTGKILKTELRRREGVENP